MRKWILAGCLLLCVWLFGPAAVGAVEYDRQNPDTWAENLPPEGGRYLFSHRMFASQTYLFFVIEPTDPNGFSVYVTEDFGRSFSHLALTMPAGDYFRALPIYSGGGGGSGEGEFIVELRGENGSRYVSFNNFHYTDSSNWLDFRCSGEVDAEYLAELRQWNPGAFHDAAEIPLQGQEYRPSVTAPELEKAGWECTRVTRFTDILGCSGERREYCRGEKRYTLLVNEADGRTVFASPYTVILRDVDGDGQREVISVQSRKDAEGYWLYDDRLYIREGEAIRVYGISKALRARVPEARINRFVWGAEAGMGVTYTLYQNPDRYETVQHRVKLAEDGLRIVRTRILRYNRTAEIESDSAEWSADFSAVERKLVLRCTDGRSYTYETNPYAESTAVIPFSECQDLRVGRKLRVSPDGTYAAVILPAITYTTEDDIGEILTVVDLQTGAILRWSSFSTEKFLSEEEIHTETGLFGYDSLFAIKRYVITLEASFAGDNLLRVTGTLKTDDGTVSRECIRDLELP